MKYDVSKDECISNTTIPAQFEIISRYIPSSVSSILEIGPGAGWLAVLMAAEYPNAVLHLMEGDGTEPKKSSYRVGTKAWNDRGRTLKNVLERVPLAKVITHAPDPEATIPADVIISTQSWGYHYPVTEYLGLAKRSLNPDGRIILDHRLNHQHAKDDIAIMAAAGFRMLEKIDQHPKRLRAVWVRA